MQSVATPSATWLSCVWNGFHSGALGGGARTVAHAGARSVARVCVHPMAEGAHRRWAALSGD